MSIREIAELTGKDLSHIDRDTRSMLDELGEDVPSFGGVYLDSMNREQTEYHLDRELTETLLTGYSAVLRRKVIARAREGYAQNWADPQNGQMHPCNRLPKREVCLMAMLVEFHEEDRLLSFEQAVEQPKKHSTKPIHQPSLC
jgi:hypothetical protein